MGRMVASVLYISAICIIHEFAIAERLLLVSDHDRKVLSFCNQSGGQFGQPLAGAYFAGPITA